MKKFFLIPLLTLCTCVMAWAADIKVGGEGYDYSATVDGLNSAIAAAGAEDVVLLGEDIAYETDGVGLISINKSVTIDGQNHKISGYGSRGGKKTTIALGVGATSLIDVTLKNLTIINNGDACRPIETRGNIGSLTFDNVKVSSNGTGNCQGVTIGGAQGTAVNFTMTKSEILMASSSYPVITFNPINLTMTDSRTLGYCSLYFRTDTYGGSNSTVTATNCELDAPNPHSYAGGYNSFGLFVMEYGINGVNITLNNCGMNAQVTGNSAQGMFVSQGNNNLTINGDNSHINGEFVISNQYKPTWLKKANGHITVTGGTYAQDPSNLGKIKCDDPDSCVVNCVPDDYEVQEVKQGEITLYRVVKKVATYIDPVTSEVTLYNLNDNVQGVDSGNNPNTSFELSAGIEMKLDSATVTAGYVQVKDNATEGATTVIVGTPSQDQTLIISNGLDVQGESQVIVQAGSTLEIGEGGINTEQPSNIVIGADENGAASLIMDPTITVNQTPNLTVKMKAKQIGWMNVTGDKSYFWHRFALPIQEAANWVKNPDKSTYVFGWNYSANDWEQLSALTQMVPFKGYTLSADYENLGDVEYTFTGQLAGNTNNLLQFERNGFNFFGNSYTGYIDILALVDQIMGDNKIDGTVWMWGEGQKYYAVPLQALRENPDAFESWQREVAPMQTFILKQNGSENATAELNYASAVWGNPRYGHNSNNSGAGAPRRVADETTRMRIVVTAQNGKSDFVMLTEDGKFSDAFEKGYDGEKYMNENTLNMYATVNGADYSVVATDNLEGQTVTINTVEAVNYTMSFAKVNGEEYAIRDNVTGAVIAIEEGATYEFAAQPNSVVEGRFEIVPMAKVPTAIENTEVKANVKGIYTIMGQYIGEDFNALPAGVYVVDGVKIVK